MLAYPPFVPPESLSRSPHRQWSKRQAREYFDWMMAIRPDRVRSLHDYLELPQRATPEQLPGLGSRIANLLRQSEFSEDGRSLTNAGHALAADMGLLVAEMLVGANPGIEWGIVERPRSDLAFQLPVLKGFSHGRYLDPVGGSIGEAKAILQTGKRSDVWSQMYTYWLAQVAA